MTADRRLYLLESRKPKRGSNYRLDFAVTESRDAEDTWNSNHLPADVSTEYEKVPGSTLEWISGWQSIRESRNLYLFELTSKMRFINFYRRFQTYFIILNLSNFISNFSIDTITPLTWYSRNISLYVNAVSYDE